MLFFMTLFPSFKHTHAIVFFCAMFMGSNVCATPADQSITVTAVGDIMMGTHFPSPDYLPDDDGVTLFNHVKDILRASDITFGNLEGSLLDEGPCIKQCKNPDMCFAFKMPERYVSHLVHAGFNILNLANNHIGDFGLKGRYNTLRVLNHANIHCAGIDARPYTIFKKSGLRIGFCGFSPNVGIPDLRDMESAAKLIRELDKRCDLVIVSFHGGAEGSENRHVTRHDEVFYGENRGNVYDFSHLMIDAGADLILGHGPHVTRALELYQDRLIAYSLGNFCTYGRFNLLGHNGIAPILSVTMDKKGAFIKGQIVSIVQPFKQGPIPDPENKALSELIDLSITDFPESPLIIHQSGELSRTLSNL